MNNLSFYLTDQLGNIATLLYFLGIAEHLKFQGTTEHKKARKTFQYFYKYFLFLFKEQR